MGNTFIIGMIDDACVCYMAPHRYKISHNLILLTETLFIYSMDILNIWLIQTLSLQREATVVYFVSTPGYCIVQLNANSGNNKFSYIWDTFCRQILDCKLVISAKTMACADNAVGKVLLG